MYEISVVKRGGTRQGVRFSGICFQNNKRSRLSMWDFKRGLVLYHFLGLACRWLAQPRLLIENVWESCLASCLCFMTQSPVKEFMVTRGCSASWGPVINSEKKTEQVNCHIPHPWGGRIIWLRVVMKFKELISAWHLASSRCSSRS